VSSDNHFGQFIRLSLGLLAIVFAVYFVLGYLADLIAERLPPRFETAIGAAIHSEIARDDVPGASAKLQKILDSLAASAEGLPHLAYKVSVHDQAAVNAVALPGGRIVVFSGLLAELKSENEVATVLAHELGHFAHRDHLHGLGRGLVLLAITASLGLSGDLPGFVAPSVQTFNLKYTRDRESAADLYAADLVARTYGHAGGVVEAFGVLARQERGHQGPELMATHPDILWRMQTLKRYLQQKKYPQAPLRPLPEGGLVGKSVKK
jgi:Zn-dependent protease with chaperone function